MKNDPLWWIEKKILKLSMHDAHNNNVVYKFVINKDKFCLNLRELLTGEAFLVWSSA